MQSNPPRPALDRVTHSTPCLCHIGMAAAWMGKINRGRAAKIGRSRPEMEKGGGSSVGHGCHEPSRKKEGAGLGSMRRNRLSLLLD